MPPSGIPGARRSIVGPDAGEQADPAGKSMIVRRSLMAVELAICLGRTSPAMREKAHQLSQVAQRRLEERVSQAFVWLDRGIELV